MPQGRRGDVGAIPRALRPAAASGPSPCGSSTKRPSVVARCPHQGVATPAMAGITDVAWSPTTAGNGDPSGAGTADAPGVQPYNRNESGSEDGNPSGAGTAAAPGVQPYSLKEGI